MILTLKELTDGGAQPPTLSSNVEDGRVTRHWYADPTGGVQQQDILDTLSYLLGSVRDDVTPEPRGGCLRRTNPPADPHIPNWYVRSVDRCQGVGTFRKEPAYLNLTPAPFPEHAVYDNYFFSTTQGPRPYPLLEDSAVMPVQSKPTGGAMSWVKPDGTPTAFIYAPEWKRWTSVPQFVEQSDFVTSQTGQGVFRDTGGAGSPNGVPSTTAPRIYLPNSIVTFTWYMVPLRYILSSKSYIRRWKGTVNQLAWYDLPGGGTMFPPGSLLYLNWSARPYYAAVKSPSDMIFSGTLGPNRLCDVEFTFLYTDRTTTTAPVPANGNWIAGFHNLQPWFGPDLTGSKFHYVTTYDRTNTADATKWTPPFLSSPIPHILFTDPDAPQPSVF